MKWTRVNSVSTANANLDGATGTYVEILGISRQPVEVVLIRAKASASTTANTVRIWHRDSNGKRWLIYELALTAVVVAAGTPSKEVEVSPTESYVLQVGEAIDASIVGAELTNVFVFLNDEVQRRTTTNLVAEFNP